MIRGAKLLLFLMCILAHFSIAFIPRHVDARCVHTPQGLECTAGPRCWHTPEGLKCRTS